jgi:hypothetical protein
VGIETCKQPCNRRCTVRQRIRWTDYRPNVLVFFLLEHERGVVPTEGLKDPSEQDRLPAQLDPVLDREILDAHAAQVVVGAAALESELDLARLAATLHCAHSALPDVESIHHDETANLDTFP